MKIAIAIDSFKGSISSRNAGEAIRRGILRIRPEAEITVCPLADGGEGTTEALCTPDELVGVRVHDPLMRPITAQYGILRNMAVMEMAAAAGLPLLSPDERNPMKTTTYGVGEMIADALSRGIREFLIGIGGSATNDGGCGMLNALGYRFADAEGNPIPLGAEGLRKLAKIDISYVNPALSDCHIRVACDVTNPLCGELGCSRVFALQKGAAESDIPLMDSWLAHTAELFRDIYPNADPTVPGSGAAGGMGFALSSCLGAKLQSGVSLVLEATEADKAIANADIVITGEGRLDAQTAMGKAPAGVAQIARKHGKLCIALSGCIGSGASACHDVGIAAYFPILTNVCTLSEAMNPDTAAKNLADTAEQLFRLLTAYKVF